MYQFTDRLFRAASLNDVYDAALDAIRARWAASAPRSCCSMTSDVMRFVAWRGLSEGYRRAVEGHSPWTRDVKEPQPICISDVETADLADDLKATVTAEGIARACLHTSGGRTASLIGKFMTYYEAPHTFGDAEIDLAVTIARQLGFSLERMRAEEARRPPRRTLRLLRNASVGLHRWARRHHPQGQPPGAGDAGLRAEEYVGRHVSDFHVDKDAAADILQRLSAGEVLHNYFSQLRCKDGSVRDVSIASSVLWEGDRFLHTRCFTRTSPI